MNFDQPEPRIHIVAHPMPLMPGMERMQSMKKPEKNLWCGGKY
jgi:hypothetical protein